MVLVPRVPSAAEQDGLYFIAYATNIRAVKLCESLRSLKKVAIVLDIDNTLIDATPENLDDEKFRSLSWREIFVESSSGRKIQGHLADLPLDPEYAQTEERAFMIHWQVGRMNCTFKVRVRPGWRAFREFLLSNATKFAPFVCSKGKLEYVQLIWTGLDIDDQHDSTTDGQITSTTVEDGVSHGTGEIGDGTATSTKFLIPREMWSTHITSTFPDSLPKAAQKTALVAVGCADVFRPLPPTQLAAPIIFLDDSPEAYDPEYSNSILYVEEYRPSDDVHTDKGSVLAQVASRLETYYSATCGEAGTFAWQAAQSFATAILGAMQKTPMESPDALAYLQVRCTKQGFALWHQITAASVFNDDVYIADAEDAEHDINNHAHDPMEININVSTSSGIAIPGAHSAQKILKNIPRPFPFSPASSPPGSPSSSPPKHFIDAANAAGMRSGPGSRRTSVDEQIHPLLKEGSLSELRGAMAAKLAAAQAANARGGATATTNTAASYLQRRGTSGSSSGYASGGSGSFSRPGSGAIGATAQQGNDGKGDSSRNISDDLLNADLMMKC